MTKQQTAYPLRMPPELREALKKEAKDNRRSLHSELLLRLHASCDLPAPKSPDEINTEAIARRVALEVVKQELSKKK